MKYKQKREKNATSTTFFTTLLLQIRSSKLLLAAVEAFCEFGHLLFSRTKVCESRVREFGPA